MPDKTTDILDHISFKLDEVHNGNYEIAKPFLLQANVIARRLTIIMWLLAVLIVAVLFN